MDYHHHARLTIHSREVLAKSVIEGRLRLNAAAAEFKLSRQSAAKWVARFRAHGAAGLADRSSRPRRSPRRTSPELVERVARLRRERWTGVRIAQATGLSRATVSRILRRLKLNRVGLLDPAPPVLRYEHPAPGDMLHLDIKKLGRIARLGIRIRAILTDNGPAYRSRAMRALCRSLGLKHRFTRPYTPRTNGKAERFIQTAIREWAYARTYQHSGERNANLLPWIHQYNWHRPHAALQHKPPFSRLELDVNNLLRLHT